MEDFEASRKEGARTYCLSYGTERRVGAGES